MCRNSCNTCSSKKPKKKPSMFFLLVIGLLFVSYFWGVINNINDDGKLLSNRLNQYQFNEQNNGILKYSLNDSLYGFGSIGESKGYGGNLYILVLVSEDSIIREVIPLKHTETPSFFKKINDNKFFDKYLNKSLHSELPFDGISGATVSSKAYHTAISKASAKIFQTEFHGENWFVNPKLEFSVNEGVTMLFLLASIFIIRYFKTKKLKLLWHFTVVAILGFYTRIQLSSTHLIGLPINKMPGLNNNMYLWILITAILIGTLLIGKNYYCFRICPFNSTQYILSQISGIKVTINRKLSNILKYLLSFIVLFYYSYTLITHNPTRFLYEPFSTLFSLQGSLNAWIFLIVVLLASFIIPNVFCRFMCPVGVTLKFIININSRIKSYFRKVSFKNHRIMKLYKLFQ